MKVLAFDTAGPVIGAALLAGGRVLQRTERVRRGAEARLVPWAVEMCAEAGVALTELDGVGVARGPGAFTGVRVGLATASGLALGLGLPIWATSSLESRAGRVAGDPVLALLDARKGRAYAALYRGGQCVRGPSDIAPELAAAWAEGPFLATGEGAAVFADLVRAAGGTVADEADHPAVDVLAQLAAAGLARGERSDPAAVEPLYLRAPDAKKPVRRKDG